MVDETATPPEGAEEQENIHATAGLIADLMDDDFQIGDQPEEEKKKKPESKQDTPDEEEVDPEDEAEEIEEAEEGEDEEEPSAEETEDEDEEEPETTLFTVKFDGKESKVTQDELIKGYQRGKDHTRKTMAISAERTELKTELESVRQERQQYSQALQDMNQNADAELKKYREMDWDALKEDDPEDYRDKRDDYRELKDAKTQIEQEQKGLADKSRKDFESRRKEIAKSEGGKFLEKYPSWQKDKAKAKTGMARIVNYGVSQGYSEEQVNSILDHRHLIVLDKARKYDAYMKSDPTKKKLKNVGKFIKPGATKPAPSKGSKATTVSKEKTQRLKKEGTVQAAASAIEDLL